MHACQTIFHSISCVHDYSVLVLLRCFGSNLRLERMLLSPESIALVEFIAANDCLRWILVRVLQINWLYEAYSDSMTRQQHYFGKCMLF